MKHCKIGGKSPCLQPPVNGEINTGHWKKINFNYLFIFCLLRH